MKIQVKGFSWLWLSVVVLILSFGCLSTKKIPAGDIMVYKKYADEIKIMHSKVSPDSELKFGTAKILFENVDFSFVRTPKELVKILGQDDGRVMNGSGKDYIQYRYRFENQYIFARFLLVQNTLVSFRVKSNVIEE